MVLAIITRFLGCYVLWASFTLDNTQPLRAKYGEYDVYRKLSVTLALVLVGKYIGFMSDWNGLEL